MCLFYIEFKKIAASLINGIIIGFILHFIVTISLAFAGTTPGDGLNYEMPPVLNEIILEMSGLKEIETLSKVDPKLGDVYFRALREKSDPDNSLWKSRFDNELKEVTHVLSREISDELYKKVKYPVWSDTYQRKHGFSEQLSGSIREYFDGTSKFKNYLASLNNLQYFDWDQIALLLHLYHTAHMNPEGYPQKELQAYKQLHQLELAEEKFQVSTEKLKLSERSVVESSEMFNGGLNLIKGAFTGTYINGNPQGCRCSSCYSETALGPIGRGFFTLGGAVVGILGTIPMGSSYAQKGVKYLSHLTLSTPEILCTQRSKIIDQVLSSPSLLGSILDKRLSKIKNKEKDPTRELELAQADLQQLATNPVMKEVIRFFNLDETIKKQIGRTLSNKPSHQMPDISILQIQDW